MQGTFVLTDCRNVQKGGRCLHEVGCIYWIRGGRHFIRASSSCLVALRAFTKVLRLNCSWVWCNAKRDVFFVLRFISTLLLIVNSVVSFCVLVCLITFRAQRVFFFTAARAFHFIPSPMQQQFGSPRTFIPSSPSFFFPFIIVLNSALQREERFMFMIGVF